MPTVNRVRHAVRPEPLLSPFGFKGAYLTELWQSVVGLESADGRSGFGIGVQSVLWSDARVFEQRGERQGNELMSSLTKASLEQVRGAAFDSPIELLERLYPYTLEYGRTTGGIPDLRSTFALNALVPVDQAAWSLYAAEGARTFEQLVPESYREALAEPQSALGGIPLIPYGMDGEAIEALLRAGYFLLKIKIGSDPDRDGNPESMLAWDMQRLTQIHQIASRYETPWTHSGAIAYYLDANGRYDGRDRLLRLLEHADAIGALERIVLLEEPFPEELKLDVSDIPVRLAADESVHDVQDALERIELGYGALALKPIAKTMSMSLKVLQAAQKHNVPCFCADLTANPQLVDWNKNLAARLKPLPELKVGILETNGHQNYTNWEMMKRWHPRCGASWIDSEGGLYKLEESFYASCGGALEPSEWHEHLLQGGDSR